MYNICNSHLLYVEQPFFHNYMDQRETSCEYFVKKKFTIDKDSFEAQI